MNWVLEKDEENLKEHAFFLYQLLSQTEDIHIHLPLEMLKLEHRLKDDLGMDSVQIVSILYELEEKYPALTEEHLNKWLRIKDVLISMRDSQ